MANMERTTLKFLVELATLLAFLLAGAFWIDSRLDDMEHTLIQIQSGIADRWTGQDQIIWAYRLEHLNPAMAVPDPAQVVRDRISGLQSAR